MTTCRKNDIRESRSLEMQYDTWNMEQLNLCIGKTQILSSLVQIKQKFLSIKTNSVFGFLSENGKMKTDYV